MANVVVLGAGRVGSAISQDLSLKHSVTAVDKNQESLNRLSSLKNITVVQKDISDKQSLANIIQPADLVVCAVPGFMGFQTLTNVINNKKNVVDISFFPEDSLQLNSLAKQNNAVAVVDMGVAPGINNFLLGYHNQIMEVESFTCYVGGLPKNPKPPFYYKAPFSPVDVVEEYTRPARFKINNQIVTKPAMSDLETLKFYGVGTLEAFNTDGLRSLLTTMKHVPNMLEKTLRWPGHITQIQSLKDMGFFETKNIEISGITSTALEASSQILASQWQLEDKEPEFTVMRVMVEGTENGTPAIHQYELYDEYDSKTDTTSMARTTGYACTAVVNYLLSGNQLECGIRTPESLGAIEHCFRFVMDYQEQRNINYIHSLKT